MAAKKFIRLVSGILTEVFGVQTSAGAGNAGDIVALDDTGRISTTMMPVGVGADTVSLTASESLAAGAWVNIYSGGVRNADASGGNAKACDGFVLEAVSSGGSALVYKEGSNAQLSGLTLGADLWLSATPGVATATPPSTAGHIVQRLGKAVSTTTADFERGAVVTLA
jgi:hypothetical protein